MLHQFLEQNRQEILTLAKEKTTYLAGSLRGSQQLEVGIPIFYDQLIKALEENTVVSATESMLVVAAEHGQELLSLGYSLSHVVHAYGAMCQAITELATVRNAKISAIEFNILNGCLDVAIASAVSEYQFRSNDAQEKREVLHLGFLAHELRNALASISIAHQMIKMGTVGSGGSTAGVLEANISRMGSLIDRSLSEVRMRSDSDALVERFRLSDLFDQILVTAQVDASKRNQTLGAEVDFKIEIAADRQFILSAVGNLIQNALKYTRPGGKIFLRGRLEKSRIFIEVEDECGGIDSGTVASLFEPYVKANADKSGLGIGLSITQRAVHLSQGTIRVENKTGSGCTFTIEIPQNFVPVPSNKSTVPGKDSIQPKNKK